jgi:hypothetical protein
MTKAEQDTIGTLRAALHEKRFTEAELRAAQSQVWKQAARIVEAQDGMGWKQRIAAEFRERADNLLKDS